MAADTDTPKIPEMVERVAQKMIDKLGLGAAGSLTDLQTTFPETAKIILTLAQAAVDEVNKQH